MLETNEAGLLRKLLPDLAPLAWRDVTDAMREKGFAQITQRYIEVNHDSGWSVIVLDEVGGASNFLGVEIDFCDVVACDVLGARRYEMDLDVREEAARNSALPQVA